MNIYGFMRIKLSCFWFVSLEIILTFLCFLCNSSVYLVTSLTNSQTLCTICICMVVSFSIDKRSNCHKGLNVPEVEVLLVCLANLASSFEHVSSILVL